MPILEVGWEIQVLDGAEAGLRVRLPRASVRLGRGTATGVVHEKLCVADSTVSNEQAVLLWDEPAGRFVLQHQSAATNLTRVGEKPIQTHVLEDGQRIRVGHLRLLMRRVVTDPAARAPAEDGVTAYRAALPPELEPPPSSPFWLELITERGEDVQRRFPVGDAPVRVERRRDGEVVLDDQAVSGHHATVVCRGDTHVLVHESRTNPTVVNGVTVDGVRILAHGDEIQLSAGTSLRFVVQALKVSG